MKEVILVNTCRTLVFSVFTFTPATRLSMTAHVIPPSQYIIGTLPLESCVRRRRGKKAGGQRPARPSNWLVDRRPPFR